MTKLDKSDIKYLVIHCSDSDWGCEAEINRWHKDRGWDGIGYHFVICNGFPDSIHRHQFNPDWDGLIQNTQRTRNGVYMKGIHVQGKNSVSIGICLIGVRQFTFAQVDSLVTVIKSLRIEFPDAEVVGHYELDPGRRTCPNFDVKKFLKLTS